jgi:hypothetical protein
MGRKGLEKPEPKTITAGTRTIKREYRLEDTVFQPVSVAKQMLISLQADLELMKAEVNDGTQRT